MINNVIFTPIKKHAGKNCATAKKLLSALLIALAASMILSTSLAQTTGPAMPGERDRCPFCGMFVAEYPNWLAQVRYLDSKLVFFDGVKDLMKYYFHIAKYEKERDVKDIKEIYVTDYYSTEPIRADEAWFVVGSDVLGPMGHELIPHRSRHLADEFSKDHRGNRILGFREITPELIGKL